MESKQLAINGGPRSIGRDLPFRPYRVRNDFPLLRSRLRHGLVRSYDLLKMLPLTLRGVTTIPDASGIVGRFEAAFCELTGAEFAMAMNSGTATLHSAYFAVGVGPGTEVIVPSYTWHATATPVLLCGAVPVFCEIDPRTLTLDPDDIERRITDRTRAICALHAWGNPAEMDRIVEIAERHGIYVIEDASHAHGAVYKDKPVGTWGHVGCFSLQGSKTVDGGEAGVAITNDPVLYDHMALLGQNVLVKRGQKAQTFDYGDISLGAKYRPHAAAMYLAHAALRRLPERNRRAARAWQWLCEELEDVACIRPIPTTPGGVRGGFYAFVFEYTGSDLGGPGTEEFVAAIRAEGAPLDVDQFRGSLLHTLPLFNELDRTKLGGGCYDPTRPWHENLSKVALPATERVTERLVKFPPILYALPESYVRSCARAVKKVAAALVPAAAAAERVPRRPSEEPASVAGTGG
jgi:dTDP-4-amino-4,6-dideoxygalactose transaminase